MHSPTNAPVKVPRALVLRVEHAIAAVTVAVPLLGLPLATGHGLPSAFELLLFRSRTRNGLITQSARAIDVSRPRGDRHRPRLLPRPLPPATGRVGLEPAEN